MAASFGEELRLAREARGIALREISEQTRIPTHYLEAIEANDYKRLPGGIFNKSFIKAYARYVGYDEKAALEAYARTAREQGASPDEVVSTPYQPRVYTDGSSTRSPLITLLLTVLILAILSLGVYALLHFYQRGNQARAAGGGGSTSAPSAPNASQAAPGNPGAGGAQAPAGSGQQSAVASQAGEAAGSGLTVQVKAIGDSVWIRTSPDGGKGSETILKPDETREFKSEQSLRLQYAKVKARQLEVTINGKAARIPADAKGNLAEMLITKDDYAQLLQ